MKNIYITASAFIALNDVNHRDHKKAVEFLMSLFNETVKVYSSSVEIILTAEYLRTKVSHEKMIQFIGLVYQDSGITMIEMSKEILQESLKRVNHRKDGITLKDAAAIACMNSMGIKDVFTFENINEPRVVIWPR